MINLPPTLGGTSFPAGSTTPVGSLVPCGPVAHDTLELLPKRSVTRSSSPSPVNSVTVPSLPVSTQAPEGARSRVPCSPGGEVYRHAAPAVQVPAKKLAPPTPSVTITPSP